jgi:hypothetical protein
VWAKLYLTQPDLGVSDTLTSAAVRAAAAAAATLAAAVHKGELKVGCDEWTTVKLTASGHISVRLVLHISTGHISVRLVRLGLCSTSAAAVRIDRYSQVFEKAKTQNAKTQTQT